MIKRKGFASVALILTLSLSLPLVASPFGGGQSGGEQAAPAVNYGPRPQSAEEAAAFNAIIAEPAPASKIALSDTFITTYPDSMLLGVLQRIRMETFVRTGRYAEAAAAGEQGYELETAYLEDLTRRADDSATDPPIDKNSEAFQQIVQQTNQAKVFYYQQLMNAYQEMENLEKAIDWGRKAIADFPQDLLSLLTVSSMMSERPPDDEAAKETAMEEAYEYAQSARTMVDGILNGPMAAQMAPEQKSELKSTVHATIGRILINQEKYDDAQDEYNEAIRAKNDDPISYFFLGMAYAQSEPQKIEEAMDALAKSAFLKGPTEAQARDALTQIYEQTNDGSEGLEQFIAEAGAKIGQ